MYYQKNINNCNFLQQIIIIKNTQSEKKLKKELNKLNVRRILSSLILTL